ncbi:MAG TPA: hypothetical protein VFJ97_11655 [Dermatophilaceae bacterium]|nr:hypothetical protein [Dermatophilaceae bacterium]
MRGRFLLGVGTAYLACRAVSFVVLAVVSRYQEPNFWTDDHPDYLDMTVLWDGSWYREIAEHGYPVPLPRDPATGGLQQNAWAFYPAFPLTVRALMWVTGLGFPLVASTLALLLGLGAALVMGVLLQERVGATVAVAAVLVWGAYPASPTLQVAYTESAAMLLLCAFLLVLSHHRWWAAGGIAILLGLTRPIAAPLGVVVLVAVVLRWRRRRTEPLGRGEALGMAGALAGCVIGTITWPAVAWWATGSRSAYTDTMATWRGSGEVVPVRPWLDMASYLWGDHALLWLGLILLGLVVPVAGPWARPLGAQLRAWALAYPAYLVLVLDPFTSIFRYLIPLFPLAVVAVGRSPRLVWLRAALLVTAFLPLQVWWTYALFRFVPPTDYPP